MVHQGSVRSQQHRGVLLALYKQDFHSCTTRVRVSSINGCRMGARKALSKLNLTTGWCVKHCRETKAQGTCVEEIAGMARIFDWCTTQVESVQYKRLQNGSQKGTIQTELDYRMVSQGLSRNDSTGNLCGETCRYGKNFWLMHYSGGECPV
jgi:hypothetical protein